jgi:plastocyanin
VVGEDADRPDAEAVAKRGRAEIATALKNLEQPLAAAAAASPSSAVAGTVGKDMIEQAFTFGPREAQIRSGESMSWSFNLCHTISFNPPTEAFGDLRRLPDGSVRLNDLAYAPSKAPPPPPISFDPQAPPVVFDAGAWDGTGYFNSGGICSLAPDDVVYKLTFSQPGTYQLRCLFHSAMQASIRVV